jgi:hypothetical protein
MAFDPQNNLVFVTGYADLVASAGLDDHNIVTIVNGENHKFVDIIRIGDPNNVRIGHITFSSYSNLLYASGNYYMWEYGERYDYDSVFAIDPSTRKIVKSSNVYSEHSDGKEGSVSELVVNGKEIYVSSVYAEGGKPL